MTRPARRPFPLVTLALAAAILGVYGVELAGDGPAICERFGFTPAHASLGTALSSVFVHDPRTLWHVGGNLAVLVLVGARVEQVIGSWRFLALFVAGGLVGASLHLIVDPSSTVALVGCSGSLFAVVAVAATIYGPGMLAFVGVLVLAAIAHAFGASGDEGVSFAAHIGGFALGALVVMLARLGGRANAFVPV